MIVLLSTSDTDLLSARASGADYRLGNPSRLAVADLPSLLDGATAVIVRILGGRRAWEDGLDAVLASGVPAIVLGGEQVPDAELMELSTVAGGIVAEAHAYLAHGGQENLRQLARFLSDAIELTGEGFEPPAPMPTWGLLDRPDRPAELAEAGQPAARPTVAILYYRAHHVAGNTGFAHALADAIETAGGQALPVFCSSLRTAEPAMIDALRAADAIVVTVLAAGGLLPAAAGAGGNDEEWDIGALAGLDVPILQGLCLTSSRAQWAASDDGLTPLDAATQVAIPEFDGRLITVPFSFKETGPDGLTSYVPDPERTARVAGIAVQARAATARPRRRSGGSSSCCRPTRPSTPASATPSGWTPPRRSSGCSRRWPTAGYDIGGDEIPGVADGDGDALIHAIIAAGGQDEAWLTQDQLAGNPVRISADDYEAWFATLDPDLRRAVTEHWGPPPGELFVDRSHDPRGEIVLAALRAGNVVVMVQPPRGFGAKPVAIYHDPDLPPSHHYLAAYHWLREEFAAHAVVHVGKHGNLEWLPGKTSGLSAACAADAAIGDIPLIYPFLVNDPGEGTQAKRRAHATLIGHLVPPMARAESYGDIARLEQLLDEHAQIAALDPAKLPAIRAQIWTLIQAAKLDHDLGLDDRPHDAEFDDFVLHVDGWLCEVKDAQIRDGLHVLGAAPEGEARVNLVLAILRARQMWGGQAQALPGLREALGYAENSGQRTAADTIEAQARTLVEAMEAAALGSGRGARRRHRHARRRCARGRRPSGHRRAQVRGDRGGAPAGGHDRRDQPHPARARRRLRPGRAERLAAARPGERAADRAELLLRRPPRGAVPARLGDRPGDGGLPARAVPGRHRRLPGLGRPVGLGHGGDADLGRRRGRGARAARRAAGVGRGVPPPQRARADPAGRARPPADRRDGPDQRLLPGRVPARGDRPRRRRPAGGRPRRARRPELRPRPRAGRPGRARRRAARHHQDLRLQAGLLRGGLLPLIDAGNWRDDADLAEVYAVWGGFAYGRGLDGRQARDDMERAYRRIAVAAHNTDTLEHDIADSDDYFQYHGGMIATVRALTGRAPRAYIGDSTRPDTVRTRSLAEETARVFRARVVNPRWVEAMKRHGYKGAFELAATVDYLFGYDATAGVVEDWMYEKLAETYVRDESMREFFARSNPWALHGITERLLEAAERKLWDAPEPETLAALRQAYLETEGDLEDR